MDKINITIPDNLDHVTCLNIMQKDSKNGDIARVSTRNKAMKWWNGLSKFSKRHYEYKMFGHGEFAEDPTITEPDIIKMYTAYVC